MQPHPILKPHYNNRKEKQKFLRKIFDESAQYYEGIVKWGWFNTGDRYRRDALIRAGLKPGMRVIDVASGTGPTARAIAEIVEDASLVTCVEPSRGMLEESKKQLDCAHIQAVAEEMPVPDGCYDFVSMGFALRHVDDLESAFAEYFRVMKEGGKLLITDVTTPANPLAYFFMRMYFKNMLPFFTRIFTRSKAAGYLMTYYWETMENMVEPKTVLDTLERVGFKDVTQNIHVGIISEYVACK